MPAFAFPAEAGTHLLTPVIIMYFQNSNFGVIMSWSDWVGDLAGRVRSQKVDPWISLP